ncbi:phytanoyl-CoA dioxygenase family protein [Sphingomonadales bacterium 56]|uniref:phytanoyl-CoA dioxygenase family protein n=1 Tax=unclassified Sphingobium TaxID=2611147 RepID=UPI001918A279|nr:MULTISPECIES: phytanoyl-CoA dioxygenase family protein [unclassified Sphingobium]MBY2929149.1 phytanoyl-CoA dioxygenase family protein [Sphingomonadales bacterium 56]MBY2958999.1 phytanoyl-CoA dioxygenase family protein [Sphingomonadales bacterium 58]CAD7338214.1 putative protein [Sphingobium sp. S8]CAD7338914.1 putative protein [Sphingobium sp. S6]
MNIGTTSPNSAPVTEIPGAGLSTLSPSATVDDIENVTDRDGAVVVQQVLSPDLLARIIADLEPHLAGINPATDYDGDAYGAFLPNTKRLEGLVEKSDAVVEAILDERYLAWAERSLPWCGEIQLNAAQLIEIGPGEAAQVLHRDEGTWPELAGGDQQLVVNCLLALSDFTEEVGATRVVVGSHKDLSIDPYALDPATASVPALMKAGDALYFTGKTIHGGGANQTDDFYRRAIAISFTLGWLKPEEAHTLSVTPERLHKLPRRIRELCSFAGYHVYGVDMPVFSHRLQMRDPYTVLFGEQRFEYQKRRQ